MLRRLKQIDSWLESHIILVVLLAVILLLRLPNFFEPYWYGDEGIYLTIGNGLRDGKILYKEIVDHKTPIIYFLAMVHSQLQFRILNLFWMFFTTTAFYHIAKELLRKTWTVVLACSVFVFFTTFPWFEGHLPNGELFAMGFILWGAYFLSGTKVFNDFFRAENRWLPMHHGNNEESLSVVLPWLFKNERALLIVSGMFFSLGVLTKVPSIFDFFAFITIFYFALTNDMLRQRFSLARFKKLVTEMLGRIAFLLVGFFVPVVISIVYFWVRGAVSEYLQFALLYNFRYSSAWDLGLQNPILAFLFTLQGKILLAALVGLLATIGTRFLRPVVQFVTVWFTFTLFAALLSNRPYPHYFQQVVPAFSLLIALLFDAWLSLGIHKKMLAWRASWKDFSPIETVFVVFLLGVFFVSLFILKVRVYEAGSYYGNFFQYITKQTDTESYYQSFNELMRDNYRAASIIQASGQKEIFIWGTNPMLYALSGTSPTGRFTVSFHIKDFAAQEESFASILQKRPYFIVVMDDETETLPGLQPYLEKYYIPNSSFEHFTLWKMI